MKPDIDVRLLRIFDELARSGNYTRAARAMSLTQSAVSHAMKRLESQLGCPLVHKKGKTTHLTPEGRVFHAHTLKVLEALERATKSVGGEVADSKGALTVIFSTAMAHLILAPVLREFRESYPQVFVSIRLEDTPRALRSIEEGECDLALVVKPLAAPSLKFHPLFQDQLQFIFSPLHVWTKKPHLTVADMAQEHFLLYQRNSLAFAQAQDYFLRMGVKLASYVEIPSFEIMKQFAHLGLGVALMAPWVADRELREGTLFSRAAPKIPMKRCWGIVHQVNRPLRLYEQTFIGLCRLACAKAAASNEWP